MSVGWQALWGAQAVSVGWQALWSAQAVSVGWQALWRCSGGEVLLAGLRGGADAVRAARPADL